MRLVSAYLLLALVATFSWAGLTPPPFPPGTSQFFRTYAADALPAQGGGVWIALPEGVVRYTAAGRGTVLPTPGGTPHRLAQATDGSIWFANATGVGRISTAGSLLEHYAITGIFDIAVGNNGALWYGRASSSIIGRITGGTSVEFPSPTQASSLARAEDGAIWILGFGFGTETDFLYRMSPSGAVTVLPLGADVLAGRLQVMPDGTLYIGTGIRNGLLRLRRGSTSAEPISGFRDNRFLVDGAHNIWSTRFSVLNYLGASGVPRFSIQLPYDPRAGSCSNVPAYAYLPLAIDSDGGLWLRIVDDAFYIGESPPCTLPEPPEMPTLIKVDTASLIATNTIGQVPTLAPALLVTLGALMAALGLSRLRT